MAYETVAFVYDEVMDDSLYQQGLDFSLLHFPVATNQILELACGTGALAVEFAQKGFDVTGLDLSEEMLTLASDRGLQAGVSVNWIAGDMLDLTDIANIKQSLVFLIRCAICQMPYRSCRYLKGSISY